MGECGLKGREELLRGNQCRKKTQVSAGGRTECVSWHLGNTDLLDAVADTEMGGLNFPSRVELQEVRSEIYWQPLVASIIRVAWAFEWSSLHSSGDPWPMNGLWYKDIAISTEHRTLLIGNNYSTISCWAGRDFVRLAVHLDFSAQSCFHPFPGTGVSSLWNFSLLLIVCFPENTTSSSLKF